ncbi:MAG: primosomal protein N' [Thermoguttaceae bacterium]|nr:primosomal protein N' [Thermoguttaceae bacterium]
MSPSPPNFFDPTFPIWESYDPSRERLVAKVAFIDGPDGLYDYEVPERVRDILRPGARVLVPLGVKNRATTAYCVALETRLAEDEKPLEPANSSPSAKDSPKNAASSDPAPSLFPDLEKTPPQKPEKRAPIRVKSIVDVVDKKPILAPKILELGLWLAKRYLAPIGRTLDGIAPSGVRNAVGSRETVVYELVPDLDARLARVDAAKKKLAVDSLTSKQRFVLDEMRKLAEPPTLAELSRIAKCSSAPIFALKNRGLIRATRVRRASRFYEELAASDKSAEPETPRVLNPEQQAALDAIVGALRAEEAPTFLLRGVTGSGKTEVYVRAIEEVVSYGKQAIVLVPEISLTPQTVQRFRARFRSVAVLHSRLTDLERKLEWEKIESGRANVVVGARSAIFAPVPRLGLIAIDEEHESSFKQDVAPRYHARVVAKYRSEKEKAPLILGSATPSLESWRNVQLGNYRLLTLSARVRNLPMPTVGVVDMRARTASGFSRGSLSDRLCRDIETALDADPKNQIVLMLNRRGYSTRVQCPSCGETLQCPDCCVPLTHHITHQIVLCHYCDYQAPAPNVCPSCGFVGLKYAGFGTQRLERELCERFPNAPILRMDADTTRAKDAHEIGFDAFRRGEYRILLGTQMIAKGLDFPNVVLVGIVNADVALHLPDFRAPERTFDLVLQAAGRAGRGDKEGKVVAQTYSPDHPAIVAAMNGDYLGFAENELLARRALGYPPFSSMIRFVVRGPDEAETRDAAKTLGNALRDAIRQVNLDLGFDPDAPPKPVEEDSDGTTRDSSGRNFAAPTAPKRPRPPLRTRLLGPAPAPFAKLRGNFRFQLQLLGTPGELLRRAAARLLEAKLKIPKNVQWIVDVDPLDAM